MKAVNVVSVLALVLLAACGGGKEVPMDKMARITVKMIVDNKMKENAEPKDIENSVIEPYAKAEGVTAVDYKYTAELLAKDEARQKEFGEAVGKLLVEEMMKSLGGAGLGGMMQGMVDSLGAALKSGLDSAMKSETK